ncbi:MAG TPA: hypothetical protein EYP68_01610 [Candidatus Korarchaeota archaeon]|nr:hypothetical protein [Candidatus Korarchaeota archaeon]
MEVLDELEVRDRAGNILKIEIREPKSWEEIEAFEEVQIGAWGMAPIEVIPGHMIRGVQDAGGVVLGAFEKESGRVIGCVVSLLGEKDGEKFILSHITGVVKDLQGLGIGYRLKLSQRKAALQKGIELIEWTFDPLQGLNSYFNLSKLGVICNKFLWNYYGTIRDEINRGMRSDRYKVQWYLRSTRVLRRLEGKIYKIRPEDLIERGAEFAYDSKGEEPVREPILKKELPISDIVLLEIPWNIGNTREEGGLELVRRWRDIFASAVQHYFSKGYWAVEFARSPDERRCFHVLWKADLKDILDDRLLGDV